MHFPFPFGGDLRLASGKIFLQCGDVGVEGFHAGRCNPTGRAGHLALEALLHGDVAGGGELVDLDAPNANANDGAVLNNPISIRG